MQIRSLHRDAGGSDGGGHDHAGSGGDGPVGSRGPLVVGRSADPGASSRRPISSGVHWNHEGLVPNQRAGDDGRFSVSPGRFPSLAPLFPGCPGLFLQTGCGPADLEAAASLGVLEQMGILLTINSRSKNHHTSLRAAVQGYKQSANKREGDVDHLLVDANRYSGKNRAQADAGTVNLDPSWIAIQRDLGLPFALTDSPYIPAHAEAALKAVLTEARAFGSGVIVVLPLHLDWLKKDISVLIAAINAAGVPAAVVLEHASDPLGVQAAVAGMVRLLEESEVEIALLRSDLSVIGAVAFGANFGAVGTTTSMRHLYPTMPDGSGFNRGARIGLFVPRPTVYRSLETLNTAIALDGGDHPERWTCQCRFCHGRTLSYIVDEVQAYQHSLAAIAYLGEGILANANPIARKHAWLARCLHAQTTNLEIAADTGLNFDPPLFQGAWHKLAASLPPAP